MVKLFVIYNAGYGRNSCENEFKTRDKALEYLNSYVFHCCSIIHYSITEIEQPD